MQLSDYYRIHDSGFFGGRHIGGCDQNTSHGGLLQYLAKFHISGLLQITEYLP